MTNLNESLNDSFYVDASNDATSIKYKELFEKKEKEKLYDNVLRTGDMVKLKFTELYGQILSIQKNPISEGSLYGIQWNDPNKTLSYVYKDSVVKILGEIN